MRDCRGGETYLKVTDVPLCRSAIGADHIFTALLPVSYQKYADRVQDHQGFRIGFSKIEGKAAG